MNSNFCCNYKVHKKYYSILLFILLVFIFCGCSQNLPDVNHTDYSVVFNFEDYESKPDARLSIFVQNNTDVHRCQRLEIYSEESEYLWETNKLKKISAGDFQWAGNVNFNVPEGEKIPQGRYNIIYVNADQEEEKTVINLNYDESLYDLTAENIPFFMENKGSLNLAIYDENKVLLYFGEKTEDLSTKGDIFNMFKNASYFQEIWLSFDKTVICVLPENKL